MKLAMKVALFPNRSRRKTIARPTNPPKKQNLLNPGVPFHADRNVDEYDEAHGQHADELAGGGQNHRAASLRPAMASNGVYTS